MEIIENDNKIIGKIEDLEKYLRKEMIYQLENFDLDMEEIKYNINQILDVVIDLQNTIEDLNKAKENKYKDCLFKIYQTPIGNYNWKFLNDGSVRNNDN